MATAKSQNITIKQLDSQIEQNHSTVSNQCLVIIFTIRINIEANLLASLSLWAIPVRFRIRKIIDGTTETLIISAVVGELLRLRLHLLYCTCGMCRLLLLLYA